jgi:RNA polymerase sigma-70 factor (ECF subfamily)
MSFATLRPTAALSCVLVDARLTQRTDVRYGSGMSHHDSSSNDFTHSVDTSIASVHVSRVPESDAAVVLRFEAAIRRFCRSRTRNPEDADDAAQDTFLRFLRCSEQRIRNHEAWLITAASRACAEINRKNGRDDERRTNTSVWGGLFSEKESETMADPRAEDPERSTVDHLTVATLLRRLNERERTVVAHLYLMGASSSQLASYLGVTQVHLRNIAMRARRHARAILADMEDTPTQ